MKIKEELGLKELKELIKADRKTEPNNSEIPNNCEELNAYRKCVESRSFWDNKHCDGCYFDERCPFDEPKDEPTISKMEQVDKDINVRSKDEPQTDYERGYQDGIKDEIDKHHIGR